MNKDQQTYQTLVDKVMAVSVTWIDGLQHAVTESTVFEYTKQVLRQHFEALTGAEFLRIERYLNDNGLLQSDANTDMFMAVYDSLWNTIEIELSKLYA
jgi:enamine deaminase RidA (YjgF/YER057c/UK114 family)